jgi:hypothetical protein
MSSMFLNSIYGRKTVFRELSLLEFNIVTCRGDYRRGFVLDDWISCTLYIHNSGLQVIQRYL